MNLPQFAIRKPVTIIVAMLIFVTIGVISILKLPLEMMPDTSFPGLMVQISYPSLLRKRWNASSPGPWKTGWPLLTIWRV